MLSINFIRLTILAMMIFIIFPPCLQAQNKRAVRKTTVKNSKKTKPKKLISKKIISGGVMNGKALHLVKPEFPAAAKKVGVHGTVVVQILIDEQGKVIETKALRGNPLLIPNSVKAA